MHNKIKVSSYKINSSREQARLIRQEANILLEKANEFSTTSRRVNRRSAYKVLARSLQKTRGLPFSIRKHQALTELSNYVSLAKYNKIVGLEAFNTDLLPVSHPRSTRMHSMTASAVAEAQMRWVLDDPRIKDETVKSLLASAMFSPIDSPEHKYSMIRLESMPQGQVPVEVLLAAANPYAGKNSAAARRAREAVQLSDRFERWINMGASLAKRATDGFRVYVARNDGSTKSLSGELLNQNMFDPNLVDIEMGKGKVATVPTKLGEGLEAFIKSKDSEDGYSPVEADVPQGAQVLPESSIVISDAPSIYRKDDGVRGKGIAKYTDDKYDIVKFANPKDAQSEIDEGQKRAAELDKAAPNLLKKGDIDPDSGKQFWDPEEPVFGVYRRGKNTPLAFAQSWKDVNNEILKDEPNLDEDEGRTYTRPEPRTSDDNVPLLDQADEIFKPAKKKAEKKDKVSSFPFEVPDRAYEFNPNEDYTPEFGFDDPVTIANDQTSEELEDALLTAVEPVSSTEKATGYAPISFTDGSEQDVPAEAIAAAIREQGGDAEMALAQAYDKIAGDNKNQEALDKSRGAKDEKQLEEETKKADKILKDAEKEAKKIKKPTSDEIIEEEIQKPEPKATTPEPEEAPTEGLEDLEDVSEDTYVPPLLEGLSEEELATFKEDGDYRPFLPKNAEIDTPEGLYKLDPNPVDPKENFTPKDLQDEVPPTTALDLSANTVKDLTSELSNAINGTGEHGSGFGEMLTEDPNGELVNSPVPAEALRDALQLKGKDTDAIIDKINKKADKAKARLKPKAPVEETPVAEEQPPAKPSIEGKDPLKLDEPFKPEDWIEADGPFAELLNSNENFSRLEGLGDLIDINSPLSRQYKENSDDLKEITGGDFGDEVEAIDERDFEGGPAGKVQYGLKILNEPGWSARGKYDKLTTTKGKIAALKDSKEILEDALNDLKTDKKETAAINSVVKSIDKEIKKLEKEQAAADKEEAEKSFKKIVKYKRVGNRTLLRDGKGVPIRSNKELADFLEENGFEFSKTVERDGVTRQVNAHTAIQDDEEFKAFARELRDRFDLDLQPQPETPNSPAQEPIDFDAPAPTPESQPESTPDTETPETVDTEKQKKIAELSDELEMVVRLISREGLDPSVKDKMAKRIEKIVEEITELNKTSEEESSAGVPPTIPPSPPTPSPEPDPEDLSQGEIILKIKELEMKISGLMERSAFIPPLEDTDPLLKEAKELREQVESLKSKLTSESLRELNWRDEENVLNNLNKERSKAFKELDLAGLSPETILKISDLRRQASVYREQADMLPMDNEWESLMDKVRDIGKEVEELRKNVEFPEELEAAKKNLDDIDNKIEAVERDGVKALDDFEEKSEAPEVDDEDDSDIIDEVLIKTVTEEENPTLDSLIQQVQRRKKLTRAERRALKKEKNHRQQMMIKIVDSEFGQGAFNLDFPQRAAVKQMLFELDSLSTEEMEDISRLVNAELGWQFIKNLKDKTDSIEDKVTTKPSEESEEAPASETPDAEAEEKPATPAPPAAEEKPAPLTERDKEILKALVDKRRKIQRKIDKADLSEETTPEQRKALKDELDAVTKIIDDIVLGSKPAEKPEETPETPATPAPASEEEASSAQLLKGVTTNNLKPGDVLVNDHFTITKIEREGTKRVNVGGVSQDIPAYRVSGYFPGSVEQSSKLWSEDYAPDVYRGATPPAKGDSPELNQPKAEDYGTEYAFPNQTKVKFGERTLYAPKNKELADKFLEDYAVYDAERLRRKALWEAPKVSKENNNDSPVTPENIIYVENVPASEVKVGDIAFRKNKLGAGEFFTVTKVVGVENGMAILEGHYVGHQTQTKEWREGTLIDVIRGEKNLPAAGDKEPLDRPDKTAPRYSELEKERKAKIAEADKGYTPNFPTKEAEQGITTLAPKPQLPAFYGTAEELLALGDGPAILEALNASENGYVVFDFETIGKDVKNSLDPDAPIQVAAVKYVKGEKVGELNLFINPGEPLGRWYYTKKDENGNLVDYLDENGNRAMNPDKILKNGDQDVTDEWLATQPDVKEQLQKLVDFFGENSILVGQNNSFDINVLERFAEKLGINFKLSGSIDTLGIARALQKIELSGMTLPENPSEGDKITSSEGNVWEFKKGKWTQSNQLADLAARLGIPATKEDKFHDALFDVEITEKVLRALLNKMKTGDISTGASKTYDAKYEAWVKSRDQRTRDISEIEAAKLLSGKTSSLDDAISAVKSVSDEKVVITEGEEETTPVKSYVSELYKDRVNEEWIKDPENTDFIPDARVKDLKPGDFIFGLVNELNEVIGFEDDEVRPADFIKVIRVNIETGQISRERLEPREDGGTGWFLNKKLDGGVYRRKENADKSISQIQTETIEAIKISDPVLVPVVEPVKGEEVTPEQASTVVDNAIDAITTSKPDASIEEAVKGLNVDETIKDQVVAEPEVAPEDTKEASSSVHLSKDGEPIEYRDRVIHDKNKRTGVITSLMPLYQKKYKNYVKVKFDDNNEKENVVASALRIVEKSTIGDVRKPLIDSDSLAEVTAKIKDIQATKPSENALNPEELAQKFKEAEAIRDKEVEKTNFVKTSSAIVKKIAENLPIKSTTKSSVPSLKTGEPYDVTFAFDKPNAKELKDRSSELNLDSEDDLIVFRATKDIFLRNQPVATIKPDGSIVWQKDNDKRVFSLELKKALENLESPVTNINAMTVLAEPDNNEGTDYENDGNGTLLGELESTFDYNNISKFPPTDEQRLIIDAIMSGKNVVVQALAGTGKTSTLVLTADRLKLEKPDNKVLYNVFNKETAEEAQGRMPDNVDSRTSDGLAYAQMKGHQKRNQLSGDTSLNGRSLIEYADYVNLFEYYKFEPVTLTIRGTEVTLGRNDLVQELREAVSKFAISADEKLTEKHFAKKEAYYDTVPQVLVDYANRIWDDAREVDGWDPTSPKLAKISFDTIFKAWAINNPQFSKGLMPGSTSSEAEYKAQKLRFNQMFMFDEAQDMNPVTAKLLKDQEGIQKVYVGDSNQAIYAFRGAINELDNVTDAVTLYLTRTFRFGPTLATIPNRFLTLLGSKKKIIGKPGEDDGVVFETPGTMTDPTMVIGRTNGRLLAYVFEMLAEGKKPGLNLETYFKLVSYAKSAKWLMEANTAVPSGTKPKLHPDLAGFQNWNEVLKAVNEGKSVGGATYFVRLLRDRGMFPSQILQTLGQITPIRGTGFREDEYVPLEKDVLKEGSSGALGAGRSAQGYKIKTKYEVKDGILELRNVQSFQDFFLKRDDIRDDITWKQVTEFNPKANKNVTYSIPTIAITPETEEKVFDLMNDIRRWLNNYPPRIPIDAELITAHKSKGKESDRVLILDDFPQPELDDEGVMKLPDAEEIRIMYVASSRAKKAIDIGESMQWIFDFTTEDDGKPELTEVEKIIGMSVISDPEPVTPEEAGKEVVKARKITDQKTLEVAERLVGLIEKGVVPWTKGWTAGGVPMNGVSKKPYKGTNTMVLWAAIAENGWKDPRFFTFNQGKELGGSVRKGEKGTTILKPNIVSKDVKQKDGSLKKQTYMYFTNVSVFNAEQFDNLKLPALIKREPVPVTDIETQILESYKDHPEIINQVQDSAYYLPSEDKIYLPLREQFKDVKGFIETLFHELAHSTGHISRLGKDGKRKDLQDNYGKHREARGEEELIAEISVALIAAEFGIEIDWGNVAAYADSWLAPLKNDPGMIVIAAKQAQDAVNRILGVDATKTDDEIKSSFPGLQDYKDGGSGGLVGSRSTVGFVSTDALKDMAGNIAGNEEIVESYKKSLREGKGFAIRDFNGRPFNDPIMVIYDNETGLAFVGEGNHRLQAAIAENIPYVPVRVVSGKASEMVEDAEKGRFPKQIKNNKEPKFLETGSLSGQPVSEGYVPPEMHPSYVFDEEFVSDVVPDFVDQSDPLAPPAVGEGVGSEGRTGEEIADQAPETPETTPEPNVGEQGQTGEEIAKNTPKNKDTSIEPTKVTVEGEEYDLWDDITYDRTSEAGTDSSVLEQAHGIFASRLLDGQEVITDREEIKKYISDTLEKYGYGNKLFYLLDGDVADKALGKDPKKGGQGIEAGIGLANSGGLPTDDPLYNVAFPVVLIRERGTSKVALLHEIAHLMEAGWKTNTGQGHNQAWHQTFLELLRREGFQKEANILGSTIRTVEGDTGVLNP